MSSASRPATWKFRLLGAAAGALASALLGLLLFITLVGLYVGMVGIPVGALIGALFAPRLIAAARPGGLVVAAALLAALLGVVGYALTYAIAEGRGASITDFLIYAAQMSFFFGAISLTFGIPMALVAAALATWSLRRAAPRADRLWLPAALVVLLVTFLTGTVFVSVVSQGGTGAAQLGDQVSFEYVARSEAEHDPNEPGLLLNVRSYWDGQIAGGSSSGAIGECSSGRGSLQGSNWAVWIGRDDGEWEDRPPGKPLVSSADFPDEVPVRLTISIDHQGDASWQRGIDNGTC